MLISSNIFIGSLLIGKDRETLKFDAHLSLDQLWNLWHCSHTLEPLCHLWA